MCCQQARTQTSSTLNTSQDIISYVNGDTREMANELIAEAGLGAKPPVTQGRHDQPRGHSSSRRRDSPVPIWFANMSMQREGAAIQSSCRSLMMRLLALSRSIHRSLLVRRQSLVGRLRAAASVRRSPSLTIPNSMTSKPGLAPGRRMWGMAGLWTRSVLSHGYSHALPDEDGLERHPEATRGIWNRMTKSWRWRPTHKCFSLSRTATVSIRVFPPRVAKPLQAGWARRRPDRTESALECQHLPRGSLHPLPGPPIHPPPRSLQGGDRCTSTPTLTPSLTEPHGVVPIASPSRLRTRHRITASRRQAIPTDACDTPSIPGVCGWSCTVCIGGKSRGAFSARPVSAVHGYVPHVPAPPPICRFQKSRQHASLRNAEKGKVSILIKPAT
nr:hypothetical protein CFP56_13045 [Quercus suber]